MNTIGHDSNMKKRAPICGGNWNNGSNAGVFALNLNNHRTNSNNNVGSRDSNSMPEIAVSETGNRGLWCPAISEINRGGLFSSSAEHQKTPKRIGFLFEQAFSEESLYEAYLIARKGKRKKRATLAFEKSLGAQIKALHAELMDGSYTPQPYVQFVVYEPKKRIINAPAFRDLVVQHAIYKVIYPIFDKTFIDTSFACRKGGGTHKASAYTQTQMRQYDTQLYSVKIDIKKFFYSIDRAILRTFFEKKIKDKRFVEVMCQFSQMQSDTGIPIGNLLSQIYALIYMNPLDHYVKRELKQKSYVRYVDDCVVIGVTLQRAKEILQMCKAFVEERLHLSLSHWHIQKLKRGINFVGYRTWQRIKFVRKHSLYTFRKSCKQYKIESIVSLIGHAKHTASLFYFRRVLIEFSLIKFLPKRSLSWLNM